MSKKFTAKNDTEDLRNKYYQRSDYFASALKEEDGDMKTSVINFNNYEYIYYGKTDYQLNSVWMNEDNLQNANGVVGLDIAVDAFNRLRNEYYQILLDNNNNFDLTDPYLSKITCFKSYSSPSILYNSYINQIDSLFREEIETNNNFSSIPDFKSFVKQFLFFFKKIGRDFPFTRVGWQKSKHSSIFNTGLCFSVTDYDCGNDVQKTEFINSQNFEQFKTQAETNGFVLHFQCPWILVFNPNMDSYKLKNSNGEGLLKDYQIYNNNSFYKVKYNILYINDINIFKNNIILLYNKFRRIFPQYKKTKIENKKVVRSFKLRPEINNDNFFSYFTENQLYELYIEMRNIEENNFYPPADLGRLKDKAIFFKNKLDKETSIRYINEQFVYSYSQKEGGINKSLKKQKDKTKYFETYTNPFLPEE